MSYASTETESNNQNEESILASANVDGTPFSVLMSQAIKMKTAQEAPSRSKYDAYPTFYKNSIFPREEVIKARAKPFGSRMDDAIVFKKQGNEAFVEKRYLDAITKYEIALSVFHYLENGNPNWKTEGIRDDDLTEIQFGSSNQDEVTEVRQFLITCTINIAVAAMKSHMYSMVIEACDQILKYDTNHVKALYLKSMAMITPKSAGAVEDEMAIQNLKLALKREPSNKIVKNELRRLSMIRNKQLRKDKAIFGGLFQRGSIYKEDDIDISKTPLEDIKGNRAVKSTGSIQEFDFDHPTEAMMIEASRQGIDLKNPQVLALLNRLQNERLSSQRSIIDTKEEGSDRHIGWYNKWTKIALLSIFLTLVFYSK